jgi:hypothetical protein
MPEVLIHLFFSGKIEHVRNGKKIMRCAEQLDAVRIGYENMPSLERKYLVLFLKALLLIEFIT